MQGVHDVGRYLAELARTGLTVVAVCGGPVVALSLFGLRLPNGWMLLVMALGFMLAVFAVSMLPALRFWWMVRRQARLGLPFPTDEPRCLARAWTPVCLTRDWLIYAGIIALHHSQIAAIQGMRDTPSRFGVGHRITVRTTWGRSYQWHLSQRNTHVIREWLKAHKG